MEKAKTYIARHVTEAILLELPLTFHNQEPVSLTTTE